MNDLYRALQDLVALFDGRGIPYAVMGGIAVRVYGIPRPTYDIDFTISLGREQLPDLYQAVTGIGYTVPDEYQSGWVDQVAGLPLVKLRLYLEGRGLDIDVFLAESAYQTNVLARRQQHALDHFSVWMVTPEDLVLLKLLAHRPRDIADIGDVVFTQGKLDETYLRHWADQLGVRQRLEESLQPPS